MPPSNFFFQIGWFLTGSRTTMPPSADTRTLTGSVVRPMRTFGPEGACMTAPEAASAAGGAPAEGCAPAPIAEVNIRIVATRRVNIIGHESLARGCFSATASPGGEPQEFGPQGRRGSKDSGIGGGDDPGSLLARPADRHAQMLRLHGAGGAQRTEGPPERFDDLPRQPLLKLQPPRQGVHSPADLGQSDEAIVRQIGDVRGAEERQEMVHADRREGD